MPLRITEDHTSAPVVEARLYPNGSVLTRKVEIRPRHHGPQKLVLPLAMGVEARSVQASVFSPTTHRTLPCEVYAYREPAPAPTSPQRAKDKDERAMEALSRQAVQARRAMEEQWANSELDLNQWSHFVAHYQREVASIETRRLERTTPPQKTALIPHIILQFELPSVVPDKWTVVWSFPFEHAAWEQSYDLRIVGLELELISVAHAHQRSGESWPEVHLTLDASPPLSLSPSPALLPLLVSGFPGPPVAPGTMVESAAPSAPPEAQPVQAQGPVSLLGSGQTLRLELFRRRLSAEIRHEAWLNGEDGVHRVAVAQAPCDMSASLIRVYDETGYRGQFTSKGCRKGDVLELPLGLERQISLRRSQQPETQRNRPGNRLEHVFSGGIVLEDAGAGRVDIDLKARLPVAGSSDVDVQVSSLPASMALDPKTGIAEGVIRLPENGERRFEYAFSVTAPRTVVVVP